MPKDALANVLDDWEHLLTALDQFLERYPEPTLRWKRDEIAAILTFTKLLAGEQLDLATRHRVITKELRIAKSRGKDLAIQARAFLKGHLGHRSVALTRFRIRPVRRRSRAVPETSDVRALTSALGAERARLALPAMEVCGAPLALPEAPIPDAEASILQRKAPILDGDAPATVPEAPGQEEETPAAVTGASTGLADLPADS